jgi:hypothetical protein
VPAAAADAAVSALGSAALLTVTQAEAREALRRVAAAELAALDAAAPSPAAAAALVAELGGSLALLGRLAAEPRTAALLADRSTDVVTLSLAALAPLKAEPAARRLVDAAVPALLAAYAAASGAGARAQLLLAPADTDGAHAAGAALAAVEGWTVVGAHAFAAATATDAAKLAGCEAFAAQAAGSALTAHCLVGRPRGASGGRRLKQTASSAAAEEPLQTVRAECGVAQAAGTRTRARAGRGRVERRRQLPRTPPASRPADRRTDGQGGAMRHASPRHASLSPAALASPAPARDPARDDVASRRAVTAVTGAVHVRPARALPGDAVVHRDPAHRAARGQLRPLQHGGHAGLAPLRGQVQGRVGARQATRRACHGPSGQSQSDAIDAASGNTTTTTRSRRACAHRRPRRAANTVGSEPTAPAKRFRSRRRARTAAPRRAADPRSFADGQTS